MNAKILDGKKLQDKIAVELKKEVAGLKTVPNLAIVQIGEMPQSSAYIGMKKKFSEKIGAKVHHIILPLGVDQKGVFSVIDELNKRKDIHGIIVQLPIPKHLDRYQIMEAIDPSKDVDGLHSKNSALVYESAYGGKDQKNIPEGLVPATAKGIISLLKENKVKIGGIKTLIIGRSLLVGKPTAMLLLKENATVTVAHSKTKDLNKLCKENDIIIVAAGKAGLIGKGALKKGQVVVDVGTNAVKGGKTLEEHEKIKLVGDVVFKEAEKIVGAISPVPGGVGPMTVASLFQNLLKAYNMQV